MSSLFRWLYWLVWHFVSVTKLITILQTAHKINYYVEFSEGHKSKPIPIIYLMMTQQNNDFYHNKMYDALVQRIKQNDFKLWLEDDFDMICVHAQHNVWIIPFSKNKLINMPCVIFSMEVSWSLASIRIENVSRSSSMNFSDIYCRRLTRKRKIMSWQASNLVECNLNFCLGFYSGLNTDKYFRYNLSLDWHILLVWELPPNCYTNSITTFHYVSKFTLELFIYVCLVYPFFENDFFLSVNFFYCSLSHLMMYFLWLLSLWLIAFSWLGFGFVCKNPDINWAWLQAKSNWIGFKKKYWC